MALLSGELFDAAIETFDASSGEQPVADASASLAVGDTTAEPPPGGVKPDDVNEVKAAAPEPTPEPEDDGAKREGEHGTIPYHRLKAQVDARNAARAEAQAAKNEAEAARQELAEARRLLKLFGKDNAEAPRPEVKEDLDDLDPWERTQRELAQLKVEQQEARVVADAARIEFMMAQAAQEFKGKFSLQDIERIVVEDVTLVDSPERLRQELSYLDELRTEHQERTFAARLEALGLSDADIAAMVERKKAEGAAPATMATPRPRNVSGALATPAPGTSVAKNVKEATAEAIKYMEQILGH